LSDRDWTRLQTENSEMPTDETALTECRPVGVAGDLLLAVVYCELLPQAVIPIVENAPSNKRRPTAPILGHLDPDRKKEHNPDGEN